MRKKVYCCGAKEKLLDTRVFMSKTSHQGKGPQIHDTNGKLVGWTCFVSPMLSLPYRSCALIDRYRSDLLQYSALQRHNHRRNFELAFTAAEKIGIAVCSLKT